MSKITSFFTSIFGKITWWNWANLKDDDWQKQERIKEVGKDYFSYLLKWEFWKSFWYKDFGLEEIAFVHRWTSTYFYIATENYNYFLTLRDNGINGTTKDKGKWCFKVCRQKNNHCYGCG